MIPAKCPTCGKALSAAKEPAIPFCSARCRQIDLARWLDERYAIPGRPLEEDELDAGGHEAGDMGTDDE